MVRREEDIDPPEVLLDPRRGDALRDGRADVAREQERLAVDAEAIRNRRVRRAERVGVLARDRVEDLPVAAAPVEAIAGDGRADGGAGRRERCEGVRRGWEL